MGKDDEFREVEGAEDIQRDVQHQRGVWAGHWGLGGDRTWRKAATQSWVELSHTPTSFPVLLEVSVCPGALCVLGRGPGSLQPSRLISPGSRSPRGAQWFLWTDCCKCLVPPTSIPSTAHKAPLPRPLGTSKRRGPHHFMHAHTVSRNHNLWSRCHPGPGKATMTQADGPQGTHHPAGEASNQYVIRVKCGIRRGRPGGP